VSRVLALVVRVARPDEYAEIGEITAAGYNADDLLRLPDGSIDVRYEARLADAARRAAEAELLVAVEDDRLLGTVTWCPPGSPWRDIAIRADQGEFRMLSVATAGRRRGVARALVLACLDRARSAAMTEVRLSSLPAMTNAHALYRQLGFERAPELDHTPEPGVFLWAFRLVL
jgi:ribosomal protein S18 acetylase RimI-like enzyme